MKLFYLCTHISSIFPFWEYYLNSQHRHKGQRRVCVTWKIQSLQLQNHVVLRMFIFLRMFDVVIWLAKVRIVLHIFLYIQSEVHFCKCSETIVKCSVNSLAVQRLRAQKKRNRNVWKNKARNSDSVKCEAFHGRAS